MGEGEEGPGRTGQGKGEEVTSYMGGEGVGEGVTCPSRLNDGNTCLPRLGTYLTCDGRR